MNYSEFYQALERQLVDSALSLWSLNTEHTKDFSVLLSQAEPLLAEPVVQSVFPWKAGDRTFADCEDCLHSDFIEKVSNLSEYAFPKNRHPYQHQIESWRETRNGRSIVVTTGTGSGKTECFMYPVLSDLYGQRQQQDYQYGVQALFLYPLNALMQNQHERLRALCEALGVTFAIYNGETQEAVRSDEKREAWPEIVSRESMRQTPPQILFTNPTMLNYMLVRQKDASLLENSKGKLRWIILDEAHSYTGSAASELALQLRRVIAALGTDLSQVRFVLTSATIGGEGGIEALREMVADMTGKDVGEISVITGTREIPELNGSLLRRIEELNGDYNIELTRECIEGLRRQLNSAPALTLSEVMAQVGYAANDRSEQMRLLNALSEPVSTGENTPLLNALLPTRAHFFVRSLDGIFTCVNPECREATDPSPLGRLTSEHTLTCKHCESPLLEIVTCNHCHTPIVVGDECQDQEDSIVVQHGFHAISDNEGDDNAPDDNGKAPEEAQNGGGGTSFWGEGNLQPLRPDAIRIAYDFVREDGDSPRLRPQEVGEGRWVKWRADGASVCPCCGHKISERKLKRLRTSTRFIASTLAPTILNQADTAEGEGLVHHGQRYIAFSDSRQSAAGIPHKLNKDAEQYWFRAALFHHLLANTAPRSSLSWRAIKEDLSDNPAVNTLINHLARAQDKTIQEGDLARLTYLDGLLVQQMGWVPKRGNTLETLGLVKWVYPCLDEERLPELLQGKIAQSDWADYLKICIDYFIRSSGAFSLPNDEYNLLGIRLSNKVIKRGDWPKVAEGNRRQHRLVLLLCAGLNITTLDDAVREMLNSILEKAWEVLCKLFGSHGQEGWTIRIDLLDRGDRGKCKLQIVDRGWCCPVNRVFVDTIFCGYSPRIKGYLCQETFDAYRVGDEISYPRYPYAWNRDEQNQEVDAEAMRAWLEANWVQQRGYGLQKDVHQSILHMPEVYLAGEHSAQLNHAARQAYQEAFNAGQLNILSCTTTMEMGIDLEGISAVVMHSVPPKASNYMQRAGRAGRRGETRSLALTICPPTPIGNNAFSHPTAPMTETHALPKLRLSEGVKLAQRNVYSLLLASYFQQVEDGGIGPTEKARDFFLGENQDDSLYEGFVSYLGSSRLEAVRNQYEMLVRGTALDSKDLLDVAYECKTHIERIKTEWENKITLLEGAIENTRRSQRQSNFFQKQLEKHQKQNLIGLLMEERFLPAAGMPLGIVPFYTQPNDEKNPNAGPSLHISQAIVSYAPGQAVTINEYVYKPEGILLKTAYNDTDRYNLQYCSNSECGYIRLEYGNQYQNPCPYCQGTMTADGRPARATSFSPTIEPSGFQVSDEYESTRQSEATSFQHIEPILVGMQPWQGSSNSSLPYELRIGSDRSKILYANRGESGQGFYFCSQCNRVEPIRSVNENFDNFKKDKHSHLRATKNRSNKNRSNKDCSNKNYTKVLLTGSYETDIIEMKLFDAEHRGLRDGSLLYSLGTILMRKLTQRLGLNDGEIKFGIHSGYHSLFFFDYALGGAGYAPELQYHIESLLDEVYEDLDSCTCSKACPSCLVSRESQWFIDKLDRNIVLDWIDQVRNGIKQEKKAYNDMLPQWCNAVHPLQRSINEYLDESKISEAYLWVDSLVGKELSISSFEREYPRMRRLQRDAKLRLVLPQEADFSAMAEKDKTMCYQLLDTYPLVKLAPETDLKLSQGVYPLLLVKYIGGSGRLYISRDKGVSRWIDDLWAKTQVGQVAYIDLGENDMADWKPCRENKIEAIQAMGEAECYGKVCYLTTKCFDLGNILSCILSEEERKHITTKAQGQSICLSYRDRYMNTPLGVIILAQLLKQLREQGQFSITSIEIELKQLGTSSSYSYYWLQEGFVSDDAREEFIQEVFRLILGITPTVTTQQYIVHSRSLCLTGDGWEIQLNPDGGVAMGLTLDRRDNEATGWQEAEEVYQALKKEPTIKIYNNEDRGLLYYFLIRNHSK